MPTHIHLTKDGLKGSESQETNSPYKDLIGSLSYAAIGPRPDICFSVNKLARYNQSPKQVHWNLAKNIVLYLIGRENYSLINKKLDNNAFKLSCYTDADYGGCEDTRRSTSGVVITLNNTPVIWKSKRQTITVTSTCEAEFIAASLGTKELLWLRNLLTELGADLDLSDVLIDNQGTIKLI